MTRSAMAPLISADGDDREGQLEADEDGLGDEDVDAEDVDEARAVVPISSLEAEEVEGVGEEAGDVAGAVLQVAEGHRVAPQHVDDADDAKGTERHHDHVEDGLAAGHAAVEERETWGHQEDHRGGDEHECGRGLVDHGGSAARASVLVSCGECREARFRPTASIVTGVLTTPRRCKRMVSRAERVRAGNEKAGALPVTGAGWAPAGRRL